MLNLDLESRVKDATLAQRSLEVFEEKYRSLLDTEEQNDQDDMSTFLEAAERFVKYCPSPDRDSSDGN